MIDSPTTDPTTAPISGSHRVTDLGGGRVIVHELELFVGFDPTYDDPEDERAARQTPERVREVLYATHDSIRRHMYPRLILGHNGDELQDEERPVVGRITDVRPATINGVPGIVGDVEMARSDFNAYLASNRFSRRSAEIYPDGRMTQVALLSSKRPGRPLPDTHFDGPGEVYVFDARPERFSAEGTPGAGSRIPVAAPKETDMQDNNRDDMQGTDLAAIVKDLAGRVEAMESALGSQDPDESDDSGRQDEQDDAEPTEMPEPNEDDGEREDSASTVAPERFSYLENQVRELTRRNAELEADRAMEDLVSTRVVSEQFRDQLRAELLASPNISKRAEFYRNLLPPLPAANVSGRDGERTGGSRPVTAEALAECRIRANEKAAAARAKGERADFAELFEAEKQAMGLQQTA